MRIEHKYRVFRPPAEGDSLIFQVAYGCPHNTCTFCGMYKGVPYGKRLMADVLREIHDAGRDVPNTHRVFLADGDVMFLSFDELHEILSVLKAAFPRLARVGAYANGSSILAKTADELCELRKLKLNTLYMGLESGDEETLAASGKTETACDMVAAGRHAAACGLRMSVMVLLGLGGEERSRRHAEMTATAVNSMQPRLLSALRAVPIEGTPLYRQVGSGRFHLLSEHDTMCELRNMVAGFELKGTVFRANHVSNITPVEARFPKDKDKLLEQLDGIIRSGRLDRETSGYMPQFL